MNRLYDMVLGEFIEEPKDKAPGYDWTELAWCTQLQLVPLTSSRRERTMPPELADIPVSVFLASQG